MASSRRPTVVHVLNSLDGGGTERMLLALCRRFDPSRARHVVVTLREPGRPAVDLPDHVACRPIGAIGRCRTAALKLARILRDYSPGIVHARNTGCWFDAAVAGAMTPGMSVVLGFHGLDTGARFSRRQRRLVRLGSALSARFTSVSEAGKRELHRQAGVELDRIRVLRNGVDLGRFPRAERQRRRAEVRCRLGYRDGEVVIGAIGSLSPVKRHDLLVHAFARAVWSVPQLRLLVVGDGPMRRHLDGIVTACGIGDRVRFTGRQTDVAALLHGMDVFACSSASEGVSNALLEALAAGLPVVTTDVGDHGTIVRDGVEGIVIPVSCEEALAGALERMGRDAGQRTEYGAAARSRATAFDFAQSVGAYESYYANPAGVASAPRLSRRDLVVPVSAPAAAECV